MMNVNYKPAVESLEQFPGDGSVAEGGEHVHDPTVVQFGNQYFCFSTTHTGFDLMRSSKDLKCWIKQPELFTFPEWLESKYGHRSIWAPDILKMGARLRMYYCASKEFGSNSSVIGLAECLRFDPESPAKGWKDLGPVIESVAGRDSFNCIDPETLVDPTGRQWMVFGSYFSGLYVVELDPVSGKLFGDPPVLVARNTQSPENAIEGAAMTLRGGHYYLFVSYGLAAQGVDSTYRIMVGRSKSPTGPFYDLNGVPMVDGGHTEMMKSSTPMIAPGHCDILRDDRGRWMMPYHYYDARKLWHHDLYGLPQLQVREIVWGDDGWPLPGLPFQMERPNAWDKSHEAPLGEWIHQADFGRSVVLTLRQDGTLFDGESTGTWSYDGKRLILTWPKIGGPGEYWIDRLQLFYGGKYYVGRNNAGMVIRGVRTDLGGVA